MRLQCPQCHTVNEFAEGQSQICTSCGFGGPAAAPPAPPGTQPGAPPGTPPPPMPMHGGRQTDGYSIAALVCGLLVPFTAGLTAIPAIILGVLGMNRCKDDPNLDGHWMAVTGLIIGIVGMAMIFFSVALFLRAMEEFFNSWNWS